MDEEALVEALRDGRLKGAGLDVTAIEPLPKDSPIWKLDNVLLSPHNMDMTKTFVSKLDMHGASISTAMVATEMASHQSIC